MIKKVLISIAVLFATIFMSIPVFADETLQIEDEQVLEVLLQNDANGNGTIEKSELPKDLVLDGYEVKSLKGLENFVFSNIYMRSCGLTALPKGLDEIKWNYLYLNDNNLTDTKELEKLLEERIYFYRYIYLDGNPCYDEIIDYVFREYYYHLSIVGCEGTSSWQKTASRHNLKIDDMNDNDELDIFQSYTILDTSNSKLGEWKYEIEDTSIAEIEEIKEVGRYYAQNYIHASNSIYAHDNMYQTDDVIEVKLLKEGYTRMKISCGEYVKYTDIWVLPVGETGTGQFAISSISDPEIVKFITENYTKEYSGIFKCTAFKRATQLTVDGNEAKIKNFHTFEFAEGLEKLVVENYTNDLLKSIYGLEMIPNLNTVVVKNHYKNVDIAEFVSAAEYIGESLEWEYLLGDNKDGSIVIANKEHYQADSEKDWEIITGVGDVDYDGVISAKDALLVLKKAAGIVQVTEIQNYLSDINEDKAVNSEDALLILKYRAGIIDNIPYKD